MGVISSIIRCFCCKVEDNDLYTPDENNHNISNDVSLLSSTSSEERVNTILSALSSRTNELLYDLNYGVDPSLHALSAPASLPTEGVDALYQQYLSDLHGCGKYHSGTPVTLQQNGSSSQSSFFSHEERNTQYGLTPPACPPSRSIDALFQQYQSDLQGCGKYHSGTSDTLQQNGSSSQSSFLSNEECNTQYGLTHPACPPSRANDALCQQYLSDIQGCGKYPSGTSDTLQQNRSCSQSSFLSHEECNTQQMVLTLLSRSSSNNLVDAELSVDRKKFKEENKQGSHLVLDAEGGEEEPVKNLGGIVPGVIKNVIVDERWIKCYSSCHMILLVGDGDFSFSACLAKAFGSASNMIATSLDSREFLSLNYHRAISNIQDLERRGCIVINGMDCTKMANNALLEGLKFDRIIFNFPFAGFFKNKTREAQLRLHRKLVRQFMENAKKMIGNKGEIHITHKSNAFHREWNLEHLALLQGLRFIEAVHFNHFDYPGYRTKTGFGGDTNFNCNPSKTYKFGLKNC